MGSLQCRIIAPLRVHTFAYLTKQFRQQRLDEMQSVNSVAFGRSFAVQCTTYHSCTSFSLCLSRPALPPHGVEHTPNYSDKYNDWHSIPTLFMPHNVPRSFLKPNRPDFCIFLVVSMATVPPDTCTNRPVFHRNNNLPVAFFLFFLGLISWRLLTIPTQHNPLIVKTPPATGHSDSENLMLNRSYYRILMAYVLDTWTLSFLSLHYPIFYPLVVPSARDITKQVANSLK